MVKVRLHNNVNKGSHSLNPDRQTNEPGSRMRSKATIKRLNVYRNFKAKRDAKGHIVQPAPFQSQLPAGTMSRVEPNRRWFGNTRVISQDALQKFKEVMTVRNPYEVMLRQSRLPVSLLDERKMKKRPHILASESFAHTFGKNAQRKKPRLACDDLQALAHQAETFNNAYDSSKDTNIVIDNLGVREQTSDPHFKAGQSKRIWNELFKVLDSSDVVLYVLDARDPMGTRCPYIEKYLKNTKQHKHFIFVINKVDLVPVWITKRWKTILSNEYPTLVFNAKMNKPLGKVAMMGLLRQLAGFHAKERKQISVGVIGYPNVGKSSIINVMRNKKVCKVAPVAGETKVWQYVTLLRSIYLIDCPGVVYPAADTEVEMVLKGVIRVEYLQQPELYISEVLARVKHEFLQSFYNLPPLIPEVTQEESASEQALTTIEHSVTANVDADQASSASAGTPASALNSSQIANSRWTTDPEFFIELIARRMGRLLKGGEPDIMATSKRILNDFQRGRLPFFVKPPMPEGEDEGTSTTMPELSQPLTSKKEICVEAEPSVLESEADVDLDAPADLDLCPNDSEAEEEELTADKAATQDPDEKGGLSSKRRRQLERALKRRQSRAGVHFYGEVDVKNKRKHGTLPPLLRPNTRRK